MPASGAAGRKLSSTRTPVCRPTPVVLIAFFSVRCLIMVVVAPRGFVGAAGLKDPHARQCRRLAAPRGGAVAARGGPSPGFARRVKDLANFSTGRRFVGSICLFAQERGDFR